MYALVSVVVHMGCRSRMGVYEAGRESSQYTHYCKLDYTTGMRPAAGESSLFSHVSIVHCVASHL